ncbi:hypothetical protein [Streptococcus pasteurianus]|uniref:hypothetical protein n=1 Tax=Streptococcus pasteurianus TaxID=197614 RepID=UPI00301344D5
METNICNECGREMSDNKKLCHDCQNKKDDKKRKVFKGILGALPLVVIAATRYFSGSNDESNNS